MKKALLIFTLIFTFQIVKSQLHRAHIPEEVFDNTRTRTFHFSPDGPDNAPAFEPASQRDFIWQELGQTFHDFFTYGAQRQQVYAYPDGYKAAVWIHTEDVENNYADMGTCYSYKAPGSPDWQPHSNDAARLEDHQA